MKNMILSLILVVVLSGCIEQYSDTEKITEYQIVNVSIVHQEASFATSSIEYVSVIYIDDSGQIQQHKDSNVGGLIVRVGNTTKFEKIDYVDRNGNINWMKAKYVLIVKDYSEIK